MGEFSDNIDTARMRFRDRTRIERVQTIIRGMTAHITGEPFPSMSNHWRGPEEEAAAVPSDIPGQIGAVSIEAQLHMELDRFAAEAQDDWLPPDAA